MPATPKLPANLRPGHIVEAALWLSLVTVLYAFSFRFDAEIEIYKFGASAWPRAILLLIAMAAIGQLLYNWRAGAKAAADANAATGATSATTATGDSVLNAIADSVDESADESAARDADWRWYAGTFALLALPFAYILLPGWLEALPGIALHPLKLICAAVLIAVYIAMLRRNMVGAMLALPVFFGALLQDFGFYALAPVFAVGVMLLMGERRAKWIALVAALIFGVMLFLFVSLLYVGLPTGNLSPFYELGTGIVTLLQ